MLITAIILTLVIVLLTQFIYTQYTKPRAYQYTPPSTYKETVKANLKARNPQFLDQLKDTNKVIKVLRFKAECFFNFFLLGVQQNKEYKPELYVNLIESINDYVAYFLLHIDICRENGVVVAWPLLEQNYNDLKPKVDQIESFILTKLSPNPKAPIYSLQTALLQYISDFRNLRDQLYK